MLWPKQRSCDPFCNPFCGTWRADWSVRVTMTHQRAMYRKMGYKMGYRMGHSFCTSAPYAWTPLIFQCELNKILHERQCTIKVLRTFTLKPYISEYQFSKSTCTYLLQSSLYRTFCLTVIEVVCRNRAHSIKHVHVQYVLPCPELSNHVYKV